MSVYSGFATRQQETFYNKVLERTIQLLCFKLLQTLKRLDGDSSASHIGHASGTAMSSVLGTTNSSKAEISEQKWLHHFKKIASALHKMEKTKYLEPKFSPTLYPLIKYLQAKHGGGSSSMSIISQSQRGGGGGSQLGGANGFFNDTLSFSSLISTDTHPHNSNAYHSHQLQQQQYPQPLHASQAAKQIAKKGLDLGKLNKTMDQTGQHQQQFSMQEKSMEEEDDLSEEEEEGATAAAQAAEELFMVRKDKSSGGLTLAGVDQMDEHSRNNSTLMEPLLRNKYSNRTISVNSQNRQGINSLMLYQQQQQNMGSLPGGGTMVAMPTRDDGDSLQRIRATATPLREASFQRHQVQQRPINKQMKQLLDLAYRGGAAGYGGGGKQGASSQYGANSSSVKKKRLQKQLQPLSAAANGGGVDKRPISIQNSYMSNYAQSYNANDSEKLKYAIQETPIMSQKATSAAAHQSFENGVQKLGSAGNESANTYMYYSSPEPKQNSFRQNQWHLPQFDYNTQNFSTQKSRSRGAVKKGRNHPQSKMNIIYNAPVNMKFLPGGTSGGSASAMQKKYIMNLNELVKIHNELKQSQTSIKQSEPLVL